MADLTGVTKYFPVASETYVNNLSSSISSGAATVPVNSATEYDDGDTVVLIVDPGTTDEAVFTGTKASAPERFVNCVWTEGNTGVGHSGGAVVTDYVSATHQSMVTKGIKVHANDDGTLKTTAVQAALNISVAVPSDYTSLAQTATTVLYNGNRSYDLTFPLVNYTDRLSPGMRLRTVRSAAAPNQSASLNGTSQYFSKTSPAGTWSTSTFSMIAHIKTSAYGGTQAIVARADAAANNGFEWRILPSGQVEIKVWNAGNANFRAVTSYQSVPLNKWTHLGMSWSSGTVILYIDGVVVPSAATTGGTAPTTTVATGTLTIGSFSSGSTDFFSGKISQVGIFSAAITEATIRGYISQGLAGTETSLISAYSLSNSLVDLKAATANNLTANGGATTTNADSPFGGQADGTISTTVDYGIIQKVSFSTNTTVTVQVPEGCAIPTSGGVASISYSQFKAPYGFPGQKDKWTISYLDKLGHAGGTVIGTIYNPDGIHLNVPVGPWQIYYSMVMYSGRASGGAISQYLYIGTSPITDALPYSDSSQYQNSGTNIDFMLQVSRVFDYQATSASKLYPQLKLLGSFTTTNNSIRGDFSSTVIIAEPAYL